MIDEGRLLKQQLLGCLLWVMVDGPDLWPKISHYLIIIKWRGKLLFSQAEIKPLNLDQTVSILDL